MINSEFERWCSLSDDKEVSAELKKIKDDTVAVSDAFYRSLEFGTGGLRGVLGAGTNRMNVYTVARASCGFSKYIVKNAGQKIAIGFDTRINSRLFAEVSAEVFAFFGIDVFLYNEPYPTPMLSYAVRELSAAGGVMITASHNPSKYNGYKVYASDGCQITDNAARDILSEIERSDYFEVKLGNFNKYLREGRIKFIDQTLLEKFIRKVKSTSQLYGEEADKSIKIVYTPLNGTGRVPVLKTLSDAGFKNVIAVEEQLMPDGNFPTCPYPNPEIHEALTLGLEYAMRTDADILLATDPDCDRVGIAVKTADSYKILTGNEVGLLLFDYICKMRSDHGRMPASPVAVKTVVTSDLAARIAKRYGVEMRDVLTGFKYIGETVGALEKEGRADDFIFGFEESCGYLGADYVRDKDGVFGAHLFAEMTAYYKKRSVSVISVLESIYSEHGYMKSSLFSYAFEGASGFEKMKNIMRSYRDGMTAVAGFPVVETIDYINGKDSLPPSDVLKFKLADATVVIRPSGTEPKIKIYISVTADNELRAAKTTDDIKDFCEKMFE